jgi:hypothetical protein
MRINADMGEVKTPRSIAVVFFKAKAFSKICEDPFHLRCLKNICGRKKINQG